MAKNEPRKDYYKILGISRSATADEIKTAYRKLAREYHPDKAEGDKKLAAEKFNECSEANETLSDPQKRARYDQGETANIFGGVNPFNGFNPFKPGNFARRGEDIVVDLHLFMRDTLSDSVREVSFDRMIDCADCHGSGLKAGKYATTCVDCKGSGHIVVKSVHGIGYTHREMRTCSRCQGTGSTVAVEDHCNSCKGMKFSPAKQSVSVNVPAGMLDGAALRVPDYGNRGMHGGSAGDLYVRVRVANHPQFRRNSEEGDLIMDLPISVATACLGGIEVIETIDGTSLEVKIPECCKPNSVIKFAGCGLPKLHSAKDRAPLWVHFKIEIPDSINDAQKDLLRRFAEIEKGKNDKEINQVKDFGSSQAGRASGIPSGRPSGVSGVAYET